MSTPLSTPATPSNARRQRGLTLLDLLVGISVLAVALLSHVGSTVSAHRLLDVQSVRTVALGDARQVLARLRSDENWPSLYGRLLLHQKLAADGAAPLTFADGQGAWRPVDYFPDFVASSRLQDLGVLIAVPSPQPPASDSTGAPVLREDVVDAAFGLPVDLNTDTVIDGEGRNHDYEMLPVIVRMRWRGPMGAVEEIRLHSWLRGDR